MASVINEFFSETFGGIGTDLGFPSFAIMVGNTNLIKKAV